jgi:hypothetical protein
LAFAEYGVGLLQTRGSRRFSQTLGIHGSAGRTGDQNWVRWRLSGSASARLTGLGLSVSGLIAGTDAPRFSDEELTVGGTEPRLFDPAIASFRLAMPALKTGTIRGDQVQTVRADVDAGLPFKIFFWTGNEVGDGRGWYRLAGIEIDERLPEMSYLRLPAVRVRLGAARTFTQPNKGEVSAWVTLSYRP